MLRIRPLREVNAAARNALLAALGTWRGQITLFASLLIFMIGSFFLSYGAKYSLDPWVWLGFGLGFGDSAILAGLMVFSGWLSAHLAPPIGVALTRPRRVLCRTVAMTEALVGIAYVYIGMYYCITYLQGWSPDSATVIHHDIFSDRPYAGAYMGGCIIMLPVLFWSYAWTDGQWGEQIRGIWKDRPK